MNTAEKIEYNSHPRFRRHNDRVAAVNLATQHVEREHAVRMRRMTLLLTAAASLLVVNGVLIAFFI